MARHTMASHTVAQMKKRNTTAALLRKAVRYSGLFSRVAREIGRDKSHVRRVAIGERRSRLIEDALIREIQRIENDAA